jgi:hypothetical protein
VTPLPERVAGLVARALDSRQKPLQLLATLEVILKGYWREDSEVVMTEEAAAGEAEELTEVAAFLPSVLQMLVVVEEQKEAQDLWMQVVAVEAEQDVRRLEKGWSSACVTLVALGVVFPEWR